MLVHLFVLNVMLFASGALCAGDNPLNGQHLRVVAMEVQLYYFCFYYCL